jgi:hypothetical protein
MTRPHGFVVPVPGPPRSSSSPCSAAVRQRSDVSQQQTSVGSLEVIGVSAYRDAIARMLVSRILADRLRLSLGARRLPSSSYTQGHMDATLALILALTFVVHLVDTLAYSVRIAGVRVRRLAVSLSLFNLLVLLARTAGTVQAPLLARRVEVALRTRDSALLTDLRFVLLAGSLATIVGALLIPTFQNAFTKAVRAFNVHRSVPRLLLLSFSKTGLLHLRDSIKAPEARGVLNLPHSTRLPARLLLINAAAVSAWTVAVLASLYAGYLVPEYRVTASSLAAVVSGAATVLLFVFSDPYLSALTDDVLEGKVSEGFFRRSVIWLVGSRLAGTLLAQVILVPAALLIARLARGI